MAKSGTNLADKVADQVADLHPGRGILWPRVQLTWQIRWQIKWQICPPGRGILWPRVQLTSQIRWQIKWQIYPSHRGILWPRLELTWQIRWQINSPEMAISYTFKLANQVAPADHLTLHLQIYTPLNGGLRFILINSHADLRFILKDSYPESSGRPGGRSTPQKRHLCENSYLADQVADFQLLLIDSYCENSYLPDQVADLTPTRQNDKFQLLLIDSYCENSYLAD